MAKPASARKPKQQQPRPPSPLDQQLPLVSGKWLAWSLLGIFGGGLLLVYLTLCLLFWQGQWQILFQRMQPVTAIPAALGNPPGTEIVHFDMTETGRPQMEGLLISAPVLDLRIPRTILFLPGTSADAFHVRNEALADLRKAGISAFTFNYSGTTRGDTTKPSEQQARDNTDAAWKYLVETRHINPSSIVFYGQGLGAALAAEAAARHPGTPGVVIENPLANAHEILNADPRSRLIPVRLLAHDRFDLPPVPASAIQPRLFLLSENSTTAKRLAAQTPYPKEIVNFSIRDGGAARRDALGRFVDMLRFPEPKGTKQ